MEDNKLQSKFPAMVKDKGQYLLVFGIIASMLVVANIPIFVIFFFGVFAYLVVKILFSGHRSDTREIFEFYLAANEILRDDDRKWFGFVLGDNSIDESAYMYPTAELRNYVKVLRKIEREPADAPLTSAAVRSLERSRRLRGPALLEASRKRLSESKNQHELEGTAKAVAPITNTEGIRQYRLPDNVIDMAANASGRSKVNEEKKKDERPDQDPFADRKPISEVLRDIYDEKAQ